MIKEYEILVEEYTSKVYKVKTSDPATAEVIAINMFGSDKELRRGDAGATVISEKYI